ncbi:MAG: chaperonin GroEL [Patescibacteria group bacterium]
MAKQIISDSDSRAKLVSGMKILASAVSSTIGPFGKNVMMQKSYGAPTITNDGVTVAKEIDLPDPFENMGAQLLKEVASKTNDVAGDGTTTATVLAQAIVLEGFKNVVAGNSPLAIKRGIQKGVSAIVEHLKENAKQVSDDDSIRNVATISSGDEEVGKLLSEVMGKVGKDGVVTVEESNKIGLSIEYTEGMNFDRGYVSPYMVTNSENMTAEYKDVSILITDKKISSIHEILPLLQKIAESGKKDLVIIAEDIEGEALATMVVNKLKGTFNILGIKAPAFGDRRKAMLQDIAILTGGNFITEEMGLKLDKAELSDLGRARSVKSTKENTTIVIEKGENEKEIADRVKEIQAELKNSTSEYDKEKLQERIAKLSGGVGVIKVGAASEVEIKEKKMRIEDALNATRAAIEEGIVAGGGSALIHSFSVLDSVKVDGDEKIGIEILKKSITSPAWYIAENAGFSGDVVVEEIKKSKDVNFGFDAGKGEYGDMIKKGIIDPVKVTRTALENAASVASLVLTTDVLIADLPEEKKGGTPDMSGMGMY